MELVRSRTGGSTALNGPRATALGWKLSNGMLSAAEVQQLYADITAELQDRDAPRWTPRPPLRALLDEYARVRGEAIGRERAAIRIGRRPVRLS